jgi:biotin carboxyl carrier protein
MSVEDPCIITCAVSGAVASREQCPPTPYTPTPLESLVTGTVIAMKVEEGGVVQEGDVIAVVE